MGVCGCRSRPVGERIEAAQTHSTCQVLDRQVRLAEPCSDPTAGNPRRRQIWIEHERPVDEGSSGIELADDVGESKAAPGERHRVILVQLYRPSSQARGFCDLRRAVGYPAV